MIPYQVKSGDIFIPKYDRFIFFESRYLSILPSQKKNVLMPVRFQNEGYYATVNGNSGYKFVVIDKSLQSDYYFWFTGQGVNWFHGEVVLIVLNQLDNSMNLS